MTENVGDTPDANDIAQAHGVGGLRRRLDGATVVNLDALRREAKPSVKHYLRPAAHPPADPLIWSNEWSGPIADRRCTVRDRLYRGAAAILSGDGAIGKTTIALQLAVGVSCNFAWLNAVVEDPGPVLFFSAEEDDEEIKRRVRKIAEHHNLNTDDVLRDLHRTSRVGKDAVLGAPDSSRTIHQTPLFAELTEEACDRRARLVIIEAAADVFAGNEIIRNEVRQFMNLLRGLAVRIDGSVLLLQHPSLTGLTSGSGTSGTTHWRNSARPFMYFSKANEEDLRQFEVTKINYAAKTALECRWKNGVFVPVGMESPIEHEDAKSKLHAVDEEFLRCLDRATDSKQTLSHKENSPGYAPKIFLKMGCKATRFELERSMQRLLDAKTIEITTVKDGHRNKKEALRRAQ